MPKLVCAVQSHRYHDGQCGLMVFAFELVPPHDDVGMVVENVNVINLYVACDRVCPPWLACLSMPRSLKAGGAVALD